MIRVLHFGMVYNVGGVQAFIMNYYRHIDREKIQFDFINIYNQDFFYQKEIESLGGKIYKVTNYRWHPFKFIKEVEKIIQDNNYEVIHCNMSSAVFLWPLIAAKRADAKVIIAHGHNSKSDKGVVKEVLHRVNKKRMLKYATHFFSCSDVVTKWFFPKGIEQNKNFYKIPNAIELEKFQFHNDVREKIRKELSCVEDTFVVGHVGRFMKVKNHQFLINVFEKIVEKNSNSKLLLVGNGDLEPSIREQVTKLGLEGKVIFLGERKNVNEYLQAIDAFVFPSLTEGFPFVAVEAQCSGVNCFFSDKVSSEVKLTNNLLFISLKNTANQWADIILKEKRKEHREKNYEELTQKGYNVKVESKTLEEMYENLLKNV